MVCFTDRGRRITVRTELLSQVLERRYSAISVRPASPTGRLSVRMLRGHLKIPKLWCMASATPSPVRMPKYSCGIRSAVWFTTMRRLVATKTALRDCRQPTWFFCSFNHGMPSHEFRNDCRQSPAQHGSTAIPLVLT
jgi:hypothetical protein